MGQQLSRESFISNAVSFQDTKLRFAQAKGTFIEPDNCCISNICAFNQKAEKNWKWKEHTIKQLQSTKLETWPAILIKFLKQTNSQERDELYKSDMIYAIYNKTGSFRISTIERSSVGSENISPFPCNESPLRGTGDQQNRPSIIINRKERKLTDDNLQTILESSGIVPEENQQKDNDNNIPKQTDHLRIVLEPLEDQIFKSPERGFKRSGTVDTVKSACESPIIKSKDTPENKFDEQYGDNKFIDYAPVIEGMGFQEKEKKILLKGSRKYKVLMSVLKKHLSDSKNIFFQLIKKFEEYLVQRYGEAPQKFKNSEISLVEVSNLCARATRDIEQFIAVLYEGVNMYYKFEKLRKKRELGYETLFSRDNITIYLASIVFNEKIYNTLFQLYKTNNHKAQEYFQRNSQLFKDSEPQHFGVDKKHCLNQKTIEYFIENGLVQLTLVPIKTNKETIIDNHSAAPSEESEQKSKNITNSEPTFQENNDLSTPRGSQQPSSFDKVKKILATLERKRSPVYKLKTIEKAAKLIESSIAEFYNDYEIPFEEELDHPQMLSIFSYVIAKGRLEDINIHCQFIENFMPKKALEIHTGQYIEAISTVMKQLCSNNFQENYDRTSLGCNITEPVTRSSEDNIKKRKVSTFGNIA